MNFNRSARYVLDGVFASSVPIRRSLREYLARSISSFNAECWTLGRLDVFVGFDRCSILILFEFAGFE